ncbi:zinc finger protein 850-like protein [Platysternon megacephalum]|uniref:Zinc finger protein 850-like protein n=1 Tax=Platysternon megacephalum TaxID=55544 RepID=A0A4D9DLD7_9SAUR|nr:zinc finger protein 850-like protein [Platysternon megacephalum]
MQENYENVISLAEEIAISWPRITAFAESHRRRGLVSGIEMESEQGQLEPAQVQNSATAGPSEGGMTPDLRRQLGLILQTAGRSQVEKMLRELVREQSQEGKRKARKKATRSAKDGGEWQMGGQRALMERREGGACGVESSKMLCMCICT